MKTSLSKRSLLFVITILLLTLFVTSFVSFSQTYVRNEIKIPDVSGYLTLKCDFHMHTVFSDGEVWPTVRVEEAWCEGLDAISITDHIEYQPHKKDVLKNHHRPYEIAKSKANELGIILIKGAEITRDMPPGHFNAIFLENIDPLDTENWRDAIKAANDQGAFVFWNHPGWRQVDEIPIWYDEHTDLFEKGWFQGIEVVNYYRYYPKTYQWALDKKLTILGNSDVHPPTGMDFDLAHGGHRPMTLVFAKEKSETAIKEALLNRRTAVYFNNLIIGEEKFLKLLFDESNDVINSEVTIKGKGGVNIQIHNKSDLNFELIADGENAAITVPQNLTLSPDRTVLVRISGKNEQMTGTQKIILPFRVKNLLIAPEQGLAIELNMTVHFISGEK